MNMSRTYKDRNRQWRVIRNSMIKKILECYSDDIVGKKKDRTLSRKLRKRLKRINNKEIIGGEKVEKNRRNKK